MSRVESERIGRQGAGRVELDRLCPGRTALFLGGIEHHCLLRFRKFFIVLHYLLQFDLTFFCCQGHSLSSSMPGVVPDIQGECRKYWLNNYKMNGQDNDGGIDKGKR